MFGRHRRRHLGHRTGGDAADRLSQFEWLGFGDTAAAFLAMLAWAHSSLIETFSSVPWSDIALLVIGMPLVGAAVAWLLGGRQPSAVSRQPLE